jgi:Restriction endonuclease
MSETPKWKQFEDLVAEIQRELTPDAKVSRNVKRKGRSGTDRQIDVLVQARVGQFEFTIVIECKHHKVPIDITDVEAFISKVEDIGATKGAMVVSPGFSAAAIARAKDARIETYGVIDAQTPGKMLSIPAAVHDVILSGFSLNFELTGSGVVIARQDLRPYMNVYRSDGSLIDCLFNLVIDRCNQGAIPDAVGLHPKQVVTDQETWIKTQAGIHPAKLSVNCLICEEFRIGRLPLKDMRGFVDYGVIAESVPKTYAKGSGMIPRLDFAAER